MPRDILHLHLPAFSAAVAQAADPRLRGRPVAVAPPQGRGVVLSASAEARSEGVRKGMPVGWARRLCPALRLVPPNPEGGERVLGEVLAVVHRYTPLWEPLRPGHLYLDLTGGGRLFGPARDVAARVRREVSRGTGLGVSAGVGGNKLVSGVASQFLESGGVCDVLRGNEAQFLAPLPIDLLPGVGPRRRELLEGWNLVRIGELARVPLAHLEAVFGAFGRVLRARAVGEDWEPVQPPAGERCVAESEVLDEDAADDAVVLARLRRLVEAVCAKLRAESRVAARLEVRLRHSDGVAAQRAARLSPPSCWDHDVFPQARDLFRSACRRRVRVRWVGVVLSRLGGSALQLELFEEREGSPRKKSLCRALDELRRRHGFDAVGWGDGGRVPQR